MIAPSPRVSMSGTTNCMSSYAANTAIPKCRRKACTGVPTKGTAGPAMAMARKAASCALERNTKRESTNTSISPPTMPTAVQTKSGMFWVMADSEVLRMPANSMSGRA